MGDTGRLCMIESVLGHILTKRSDLSALSRDCTSDEFFFVFLLVASKRMRARAHDTLATTRDVVFG